MLLARLASATSISKSRRLPRELPLFVRARDVAGPPEGSVSTRASKYRLSWDEANPGSCGLQNGQHGRGPPEVKQSASVGGNMLVVAGARAEEVAQFIVSLAEPGGRSRALEAPHGPIAWAAPACRVRSG